MWFQDAEQQDLDISQSQGELDLLSEGPPTTTRRAKSVPAQMLGTRLSSKEVSFDISPISAHYESSHHSGSAVKMQYLPTLQVGRYCFLALHNRAAYMDIPYDSEQISKLCS